MPKSDSYLPPYGTFCSDDEDIPIKPIRKPPNDPEELTLRIQRLVGRISYQLQTLSDLEMTRESLHWQIRSIDPESSLYALSLKSKPALLAKHTEALRQAVENSEKIKEISRIEQLFWRWAHSVLDNLHIDRDRFDETRSVPCEWYPPFTHSPFARYNKGVHDLNDLMADLRTKVARCVQKFGHSKLTEKQAEINMRQADIVKREVMTLMDSLERLDEVKIESKEELAVKLIPALPFKEFSDTKLQRIIVRSQRKSREIAMRCCPEIASIVKRICGELGYVPHGWSCNIVLTKEEQKEDEIEAKPKPKAVPRRRSV
jgi:hypothetical protein